MSQTYRAHLKSVRVSARKARLVVNLVRGKQVQDALEVLRFTRKKTAPIVHKLISSALASAEIGLVDVDSLVVKRVYVNEGPTLRRFLPRAQGRATPIRKRSSHITVELAEEL